MTFPKVANVKQKKRASPATGKERALSAERNVLARLRALGRPAEPHEAAKTNTERFAVWDLARSGRVRFTDDWRLELGEHGS